MKRTSATPNPPRLTAPVNGDAAEAGRAAFSWEPVEGAEAYGLQVARDEAFEDVVLDEEVPPETSYAAERALPPMARAYWRARTRGEGGWGDFGEAAPFEVRAGAAGEEPYVPYQDESAFGLRGITLLLVAIAVSGLAIFVAAVWLSDLGTAEGAGGAADPSIVDSAAVQAALAPELDDYAVDSAGTYRIPIDRAMELVAEEAARRRGLAEPSPLGGGPDER